MRQSITRRRSKTPMCDQCGAPLETATTARNPSAEIRANSIASCPSCMHMFLVDAYLRPLSAFEIADEAEWNAALRVAFAADPELEEWERMHMDILRINSADERKARCAAAREWLTARGGPGLTDDLAALNAYAASFDDRGYTSAPPALRLRANGLIEKIMDETHRQTRH